MKLYRRLLNTLCLVAVLGVYWIPSPALAQTEPETPIYIVQEGDTLNRIALQFGVSTDDLLRENDIPNPDILSYGMQLRIPGVKGVSGILTTETIALGETLSSLSVQYDVDQSVIVELNRITSPAEVYAGASLILPQAEQPENEAEQKQTLVNTGILTEGQSWFEAAVAANHSPWELKKLNRLQSEWDALPGDKVFSPSDGAAETATAADGVLTVQVEPLPMIQGETAVVRVTGGEGLDLQGVLAGNTLRFFETKPGEYVALQGLYVMDDPGLYSLELQGVLNGKQVLNFSQMVVMAYGGYTRESIDGVDPVTIDPAVTAPEEKQVREIVSKITPEQYWDGIFLSPGYDPNWITSWFGTRRSYNGSAFTYFHSGIDYGSGVGLPIKSPAAGVVVFAGPLTVRGNATIIDHGHGVYSGFWHQSQFEVKVGDRVEAGQEIGLAGDTGRVTGPHLHWEIWVNGNQVDPMQWLNQVFP